MIGTYLVTGARGHLGSALLRLLSRRGQRVRGLVLPGEGKKGPALPGVELIEGDVCRPESLEPLVAGLDGRETALIHTAGIVDISGARAEEMRSVNVGGTANVVELCRRAGIGRLVYVSSVHAIPEGDPLGVLRETCAFSPDKVVGSYAKTKAEATALVLSAARQGLPAVVVHPSGILGPYESGGNHLVQMVRDYLAGKLLHGGLSALFVAGLFRLFSFEAPASAYLADQVASIAGLDFHTALVISTVSAWVVWLLFFAAAAAAIRRCRRA